MTQLGGKKPVASNQGRPGPKKILVRKQSWSPSLAGTKHLNVFRARLRAGQRKVVIVVTAVGVNEADQGDISIARTDAKTRESRRGGRWLSAKGQNGCRHQGPHRRCATADYSRSRNGCSTTGSDLVAPTKSDLEARSSSRGRAFPPL